jgi:hypothetical protein
MKKRKMRLAELRSGQPILSYGHPADWLLAAVGTEAAHAAVLFDAPAVELLPEGVTIRLNEARRAA